MELIKNFKFSAPPKVRTESLNMRVGHPGEQIVIIPNPELTPVLVYSQQQLELKVTSLELAITCPDLGQTRIGKSLASGAVLSGKHHRHTHIKSLRRHKYTHQTIAKTLAHLDSSSA